MPIRIQDAPSVLPGVGGGGGFSNPQRGATSTSIVADQIQSVGKSVQGVAGDLGKIIAQEQEKANKARLNDAYNQALSAAHALRYSKDAGYTNLKGAEVGKGVQGSDGSFRPLADAYGEKLDKELSRIRQSLGNQAVQADFDMLSSDLGSKFRNEAMTYEAEQFKVYEQSVRDATIVASANEAAVVAPALTSTDPNTRAAAEAKLAFHISQRARPAAEASAKAKGLEGEAFDQAVKEQLGAAHEAVITSLLERKDVASAKAYFDSRKDDFSQLKADEVKAKLDKAYSAAVAVTAADEVIANNGGLNPLNRSVNIDKMHAELRTRFKDDPEALKAARAELDYRYSIHDRQQREYDDGNVSAVWKRFLAGDSVASVEGTRAWLALPGDKQASLKSAYDNYKSGTVPDEYISGWFDHMLDDNWLRNATAEKIDALLPFYGPARTAQLVTAARNAKAGAAGQAAKATLDQPNIPASMVSSIAAQYGLDPTSENNKLKIAQLQTDLYNMAAREQAATGKIIAPGEMENFLRSAIARSGAAKSASYLRQNPDKFAKVPLPAIGTEASAQIAGVLQRKGLPPTTENQRAAWLEILEAGSYLVDE